jgi:hypothetical protein
LGFLLLLFVCLRQDFIL